MNPRCIAEVASVIGREPTAKDVALFEGGLLQTMRNLARTDPAWRQKSRQQQLLDAAAAAKADALASADVTAARRASNLVAQARESQRMLERAKAKGGAQAHHDALFERMRQLDDYVAGVRNEAMTALIDAIEVAEPGLLGLFHDEAKLRQLAKAIMGEQVDDPAIVRAAKAYNEGMENLRLRANDAGADIGKIDYSYLPQPHDVGRIARAGQEAWVASVLPKLNRSRYVTADGSLMGDAELVDLLNGAWDTITTEGRNKLTPGTSRGGSRASRFDDAHRAIHFKDADSHLDYLADFGRGSMLDAIHSHVGMMAKTIGLMEEFGPNPNSTFRLLKDLAEQKDNVTGKRRSAATLDMVWDTLNGTTSQPVSARLAQFFQGVRNFTVAAKLQGVMLSAITDAPLQVIVAKSNGVPLGEAMTSLFNGFGSEKQALARSLAIGMDEISGEISRWHTNNLAQGWTSKLANATMRATLVEAWSNGLRRGFGLTLSETLHRMRAKNWDDLSQGDRQRFEVGGVTPADWKLWQLAEATDYNGVEMLTKDGLRAIQPDVLAANGFTARDVNQATARLLGYIDQEAHTAVLTSDLMTRAGIQQGTKAGTVGGEVLRSVMLFKSFGLAIVDKHLRRIANIPTTQGKAAYSIAMMTTLPLFGAVSLQLKDLASGKDPRDMTSKKFWLAAAMQGGGLGIFGDILYTGMGGNARGGQSNWTSLAGPVFGNAMDLADIGRKSVGLLTAEEAREGKAQQQLGASLIRFVRSNTPFANLWYLRAAIDHAAMHDLQEAVSPGYLDKMRKRSQRDWNQDYWYEPGEALPSRAPDLAAVTGED